MQTAQAERRGDESPGGIAGSLCLALKERAGEGTDLRALGGRKPGEGQGGRAQRLGGLLCSSEPRLEVERQEAEARQDWRKPLWACSFA